MVTQILVLTYIDEALLSLTVRGNIEGRCKDFEIIKNEKFKK